MSETYQKCACRSCGGHIEFPSRAVGMSIGCPHCGATTDLYAEPPMPAAFAPVSPPPPPPPPPVPQAPRLQVQGHGAGSSAAGLRVAAPPPPPVAELPQEPEYAMSEGPTVRQPINWIGWSLATVSILLFLVGGAMYLSNAKQGKSALPRMGSSRKAALRSAPAKPDPDDEDEKSVPAAKAAAAKSIEDLKPGAIALQKAPGSSLVYAVGTLRNDSDQQRFGVRIELHLFDAAGKQIMVSGKPAKAEDYVQVIEPHKDWRFRALVVAPKTATARVAKIKEEE